MIKKYLMYFGAMLGILVICMGGLIGTAFLYNYIVTTFSVSVVQISTLGFILIVAAAALAVLLALMDKDDYDL